MKRSADYILENANILTLASPTPHTALAVGGGRVLGVGTPEELESLAGPGTRRENLGGRTILPGLNDNHCHPLAYADSFLKVDLSDVTTQEDLLRRLADRAAVTPAGEWIFGYGYNEMAFPQQREPNLAALDAAVGDHPLFVTRYCLHAAVVNSAALARVGWDETTQIPGGSLGKDANGRLTGRLDENAKMTMDTLVPAPSVQTIAKAIQTVCQTYNAYGVTSIADMGSRAEEPPLLSVWAAARSAGYLTLRVSSYLMDPAFSVYDGTGLPYPFGDALYRVAGRKLFVDGAVGGGTAGTSQPSAEGGYGIYHHSQEELDDLVWQAHARGIQISTHAMGDQAIRMTLDAYRKAQQRLPLPDIRHRIEHAAFADEALLGRMAEEGVWPLFNPNLHWYFGQSHITHYGQRGKTQYPFRAALDKGLLPGNGSDCPVTPPDPRPGLYAAVNRVTKEGTPLEASQAISPEEALKTYTLYGAYLTHEEQDKGTLEPGKLADFIVVDRNPLAVPPEELLDLQVERTVLGGKTVYAR